MNLIFKSRPINFEFDFTAPCILEDELLIIRYNSGDEITIVHPDKKLVIIILTLIFNEIYDGYEYAEKHYEELEEESWSNLF